MFIFLSTGRVVVSAVGVQALQCRVLQEWEFVPELWITGWEVFS